MTDPPHHPRSDGDDTGGLRRWIKVVGIAIAVAILLVVVLMLIGGEHGPSRHFQSGDLRATDHSPPAAMHAMPGSQA